MIQEQNLLMIQIYSIFLLFWFSASTKFANASPRTKETGQRNKQGKLKIIIKVNISAFKVLLTSHNVTY